MTNQTMDNWETLKNLLIEQKVLSQKETVSTVENTVIMQAVDQLLSTTKIEKALQILDGAIGCQTHCIPLYQKKSQILFDEGFRENAIQVLLDAHQKDVQNVDIILSIGEAYQAIGNHNAGIGFLDKCLELEYQGLEVEIILMKCNLLCSSDQIDEAFDLISDTLSHYPNDPEVHQIFNRMISINKMQETSESVIEQLIDCHPYSEQAWLTLGHIYYYNCKYAKARMSYEYAFLIEPLLEEAHRQYISVCLDTRSYRKALKVFSEMIQKFDLTADDLVKIADCYIELTDYKRAISFLEHAVKKDPLNDQAFYKIGLAYSLLETHSFCLNYIKKAIRLNPDNEDYHVLYGQVLYQLGDKKAAFKSFYNAIDIDPLVETSWEAFLTMLIHGKDYYRALDVLDEADMATYSLKFEYMKAACLYALGKRKEANHALEDALVEAFTQHQVLFDLMPRLTKDKQVKDMIAYYLFEG
ncbi:MAG: tetratricopeptide repeat protein [Bacteroidia bacterium]|nr:tetratricopeptide repeat protein [Bacteroidia bacterium]